MPNREVGPLLRIEARLTVIVVEMVQQSGSSKSVRPSLSSSRQLPQISPGRVVLVVDAVELVTVMVVVGAVVAVVDGTVVLGTVVEGAVVSVVDELLVAVVEEEVDEDVEAVVDEVVGAVVDEVVGAVVVDVEGAVVVVLDAVVLVVGSVVVVDGLVDVVVALVVVVVVDGLVDVVVALVVVVVVDGLVDVVLALVVVVVVDGLSVVVVTHGERGTEWVTRHGSVRGAVARFDRQPEADNVGAGDACSAGLLWGWLNGWQPEQTVTLANRLGAFVASRPGATPPIPS